MHYIMSKTPATIDDNRRTEYPSGNLIADDTRPPTRAHPRQIVFRSFAVSHSLCAYTFYMLRPLAGRYRPAAFFNRTFLILPNTPYRAEFPNGITWPSVGVNSTLKINVRNKL